MTSLFFAMLAVGAACIYGVVIVAQPLIRWEMSRRRSRRAIAACLAKAAQEAAE